jgi:hypothetical protein
VHIEPCFVQLTHADNICLDFGNIVDTRKGSILTGLAPEDDNATTFNPHHQTIAESDHVTNVDVELSEGIVLTGHVVGGAHVHHPPGGVLDLLLFTQMGKHLLLDEVHGIT